jgi:hypothetical protein
MVGMGMTDRLAELFGANPARQRGIRVLSTPLYAAARRNIALEMARFA